MRIVLGELKHCSGEKTAYPEEDDDKESFLEEPGEFLLLIFAFY